MITNNLWQIFVISMLPLTELRGAIPIGIGLYHLDPVLVLVVAFLGNIIPVILILLLLDPITKWLRVRSKLLDKFFSWLFAHTYKKHSAKFERWGSLALLFFVAIPLPVTGGWTGALLAYLFGIKLKHALPNILIGILIAGGIVTLVTLGGVWILQS